MPLAKVRVTARDGGLGILGPDAAGRFVAIGVSAKAAPASGVSVLTLGDPVEADSQLGRGPLRDLVTTALSLAGTTCYAIPLAISGGGTSTVTAVGDAPDVLGVKVDPGSEARAADAMDIEVTVVKAGALGTAAIAITVDGEPSTINGSTELTIANPGPDNTAITELGQNFVLVIDSPSGGFEVGDTWRIKTTYPSPSTNDVTAAMAHVLGDPGRDFEFISIAGPAAQSVGAGVLSQLQTALARYPRHVHVKMQALAPGADTTAWVDGLATGSNRWTSVNPPRLQVHAGWVRQADATSGRIDVRPAIDVGTGLTAARRPWEPVDAVANGSIPGVTAVYPDDLTLTQIETLQDAGYAMPRRYFGLRGVYLSRGQMLVERHSDYQTEERRRVMDYACRRVYRAQIRHLNSSVLLAADGTPAGLELFRAESEQPLREMVLQQQISSFELTVPAGQNILSDETLRSRLRIVPRGKASQIETEIAYRNPVLDRQAANEGEA